jgi:hypothetical protein
MTRREKQLAAFNPFGKGSGVFGKDLRCKCGEGAKDVSPSYEIGESEGVEWTCRAGHMHVSGFGKRGKWAQIGVGE